MKFRTPSIYATPGESGMGVDFDREFEMANMSELVKSGWPVNWNYVDKNNIIGISKALIFRALNIDSQNKLKLLKTISRNTASKIINLLSSETQKIDENHEITTSKA